MDDLGAPVAYAALPTGAPAFGPDGALVATVAHVLADDDVDIFHGLILDTPDGYRFADPEQVAALHERGVQLAVPAQQLHHPNEDPVADRVVDENRLRLRLRRFRHWLQDIT